MPQDKAPLLVAITGNIGSGKSSLSSFIMEEGYPLFSADVLAKSHLNDPEIKLALAERWGSDIYKEDELDRKKLAEKVFANPSEIAHLNRLIHPKVIMDFSAITTAASDPILFFEVPLLFEAKLSACFDYIVLVKATHDMIVSRLQNRDRMSLPQIEARLQAQIPDSEKEAKVDYVILNDGSLEQLREKTLWLLKHLQSLPGRKKLSFAAVLGEM